MHVNKKQSEGEALDETSSVWYLPGEDILKGALFFLSFSLLDTGGDLHDVKGRREDLADTRMLAGGDILCHISVPVLEVRFPLGSPW